MFNILLLLFASTGAGFLLRRVPVFEKLDKTTSATVLVMLFIFGASIGHNREVMRAFAYFGWQALLLAFAGVCGSCLLAGLAVRYMARKGGRHER